MNKLIISLSVAILSAACATTGSLRTSSIRLDDRANQFYAQIRYQGDDSRRDRVSRDAEALATSAHNFNRAVEENVPHSRMEAEFSRVAENYQRLHEHLADEGYASQNHRVLEEFDRVTQAYRTVENSMGNRHAEIDSARERRDYARD